MSEFNGNQANISQGNFDLQNSLDKMITDGVPSADPNAVDDILVDSLRLRPKNIIGAHFAPKVQAAFSEVAVAPTEIVETAIADQKERIGYTLGAIDYLYDSLDTQTPSQDPQN